MTIARTMLNQTGTALIDSMIGNDYDVVKTVYQNLDAIKAVEEVDIDWLKENIADIRNVSNASAEIKNLSLNLNDVLAAPLQAKQYVEQAKLAIEQATLEGTSYINEAKKVATSIQEQATKLQSAIESVEEIKDEIVTVAGISKQVKVVSNHKQSIDTVAQYINVTTSSGETPINDFGVIGSEDTEAPITESPLETISNNIQHLLAIRQHLDELIYLASDGNLQYLIKLASKIEGYIKTLEKYKDEFKYSLEAMDKKTQDFDKAYKEALKNLEEFSKTFKESLVAIKDEVQSLRDESLAFKNACSNIADECNSMLLRIKEYYALCKTQLETDYRKYSNKIAIAGDTHKKRIENAATDAIERIEESAKSNLVDILAAIKVKAEAMLDAFKQEIETTASNLLDKFNSSVEKRIEELKGIIEATAQTQIDRVNTTGQSVIQSVKSEGVTSLANIQKSENDTLAKMREVANAFLEQINNSTAGYIVFKGSVDTINDLPTNAKFGDMYNIISNGANYIWTGSEWDNLAPQTTVDLGIIGS